ncbi:MAG TPA: hypothetical protein DCP73_04535, partial [Chloroflexi bacterium]|nr:hypothetical protein [Chloroflexota bacterium]
QAASAAAPVALARALRMRRLFLISTTLPPWRDFGAGGALHGTDNRHRPASDDWINRTPTYTVMQLLARTGVHQPVTLACKRVDGKAEVPCHRNGGTPPR